MELTHKFKLSLLSCSLLLAACGGSDGKDPEVSVNQAPTVTLANTTVNEKAEVNLSASATDTDGTIASFLWEVTSSHDIALTGADTATPSFTAPEVGLEGDTVALKVTVTDDDGATASASTEVKVNPLTLAFTLQGMATDSPLENAQIKVTIGGREITVDATADENGNYNIDLLLDDSETNAFVSIVAMGVGEQTNAGLISLLGSVSELNQLAGADGIVSAEDHFAVNVTNVTTAQYALAKLANNNEPISNSEQFATLAANLNPNEVMALATAIKVAIDKSVDNPDLGLPEGINNTLELVANVEQTQAYVEEVQQSAEYTEAQQEIFEDPNLVDTQSTFVVPETYYLMPQSTLHSGSVLKFKATNAEGSAGTGTQGDSEFDWTLAEGVLTLSYGENLKSEEYYIDRVIDNVHLQVLVRTEPFSTEIRRLQSSADRDLLALTQIDRWHFPNGELEDEFQTSNTSLTALKPSAIKPISHTGEGYLIVPTTQEFKEDTYTSTDTIHLAADGSATGRFNPGPFNWQLEDGQMVLSFGEAKVRFVLLDDTQALERYALEVSEDGVNFNVGYTIGEGKLLVEPPVWATTDISGIYSYDNAIFNGEPGAFWFELHENKDVEIIDVHDWNGDGILSDNEFFIQYGNWTQSNDGAIHIQRTLMKSQDENGDVHYSTNSSCRTQQGDCVAVYERTWSLLGQKDNQYGVMQKRHNFNGYYDGESKYLDNRTLFKLAERPLPLPESPKSARQTKVMTAEQAKIELNKAQWH
ncbi:PKD domain-containing protein [Shewanella cyperi]|uniref:PKD domain-containing protein n=1 Tax=Shewanella cyperi TaxID=2814292 RepID=A0A975AL39_9GAMM|nr:carboxypeptidase-like regulatory domain-containing protein [Shewanella cyperi]QSX30017.1 PKD domain-containing protein [Shewanella cyperi]